ncbi:MAG: shikimate kinase [Aphanocapsa sp. GSE-SYN-MK-11-07L]|jgi:shikimate kinase|nr:shikimate kinase [Aphanocapsa sp. GSE-SYN-MK-11-07L]
MTPLTEELKGVNLYLIGMMGAGKTSTGKLLAQSLGYRFFDTDALIEQVAGQSINEMFAEMGESEFRRWETQVLAELSAYKNLAIATGGGIVVNPMNWSYLHHGLVIWLDAPIQLLTQRLEQAQNRPLLQVVDRQQQLTHLFDQRQKLYAQADIKVTITADQTRSQAAESILEAIADTLKSQQLPSPPSVH